MGNGNIAGVDHVEFLAALLTPHGERERDRDEAEAVDGGLLTPHGEREPNHEQAFSAREDHS